MRNSHIHKNFALYVLAVAAALLPQVALAHVNADIGTGVPVASVYVEPAPAYVPPPPSAYYAPTPVYVVLQPIIVAPGYYDDGRGREWQERQWREQRWREHEWHRHHRHDDDD